MRFPTKRAFCDWYRVAVMPDIEEQRGDDFDAVTHWITWVEAQIDDGEASPCARRWSVPMWAR